jgi:hypothetical protein
MEEDLVTTPAPRRLLHVINGDATRMSLEQSGVPGRMVISADVLGEGPCPPVEGAAWWEVRGRFLSQEYDAADARSRLEEWDRALDDAALNDEVILWFEHDLFDQLLLIRLLAHFADRPAPLSLVCIGEHPAVPAFKGLGELTPDQLASLYETRAPVDAAMLAVGRDAWAAYRAPDPTVLERLLERDLSPLPFLARALRRHLEEYPWVGDWLTRTERQILIFVRDGATDPWKIFRRLHELEDCHYVADSWYLRILRGLAAGPAPLLGEDLEHLSLTPLGNEVLAGRADRVKTAGIDRWLGGVHLEGSSVWRWDPGAKRLRR